MSVAWVTSLSRVSDHVHHLSDVVVGVALGAAVGAWAEEVEWQSAAGARPEAAKDIGQSGRRRRQQVGQIQNTDKKTLMGCENCLSRI